MKANEIDLPTVSVVIPTYNRKEKLLRLLKSLLNSDYPKNKMEIIIVDDCSSDGTYQAVNAFIRNARKTLPQLKFKYIRHKSVTLVAKSRNDGILLSSSEFVFFVDDDNVVAKDTIRALIKVLMSRDDIGVAGPVTYYLCDPKVIQYAGAIYAKFTRVTRFLFHNIRDEGNLLKGKIIEVDGIPNSFMLRKSLAIKAGLIPWKRIPWNGEDGYLQYKIKKLGYKIVIVGDAKVYHDAPMEITAKYNPMRLYYALRSKIIFHMDLDDKKQVITFLFSLPIYIVWYTYIALKCENKVECLKAVLKGVIDGIRREEGLKYVQ